MKKVLAIVGPTASGKTDISVEIARRLNGEIISADSRQVYKGMPVSTSQPSEENLNSVKHHFISELNPDEEFNSGEFGIIGRKIIDDIFSRNKLPVICGGSGLYIRSLIDGFFEEKIESKEIRERLYRELNDRGEDYLYEELRRVDPESSQIIPPRKVRRVIRALEIYYATGKKISELQKNLPEINFKTFQIGLSYQRKILYERINQRVDRMIEEGLLNEVRELMNRGYHYGKNYPVDTVGVKEVMKYFEGEFSFEEMLHLIKQNTRRYAKRQLTWFRKDKRILWLEAGDGENADELAEKVLKHFEEFHL